jgi:hypothetical protein
VRTTEAAMVSGASVVSSSSGIRSSEPDMLRRKRDYMMLFNVVICGLEIALSNRGRREYVAK